MIKSKEIRNQLYSRLYSRRFKIFDDKVKFYKKNFDKNSINDYQIKKFNVLWEGIKNYNFFYKYWSAKHKIPDTISNLKELHDWPVIDKFIINEYKDLIFKGVPKSWNTSSGGTSGVATKFPVSPYDKDYINAISNTGRKWNNIDILDSKLMFWGHSHLLGSGRKYYINKYIRSIKDYCLNVKRFSAYDLSENKLIELISLINKHQPKVLISYASCILRLTRFISHNNIKINSPAKIILTSETVENNELKFMNSVMHSDYLLEYGMAEAGVISYSRNGTFSNEVFWDSFVIQANDKNEVRVTTLWDKLFPLINYCPNDKIVNPKIYKSSILSFENIQGKDRPIFKTTKKSGEKIEISLILIDHIMKYYPGVYSTQYECKNGHLIIRYVCSNDIILNDIEKYFKLKLLDELPGVSSSNFQLMKVEAITTSIAGKQIKYIDIN